MNLPIQPVSLSPLPAAIEAKGFSLNSLQEALSLQPSLASQAALQTMGGNSPLANLPLISSTTALNPLSGGKTHSDEQIKKVSKNFEAIFMRMIFKEMRNSVQKTGLMGSSQALDFFETMRDEQLSESLANAGGLGIGKMVYQKLKEATVPHQKSFK